MAEKLSLSTLKPAAARRDRKRVGRGPGSGKGRYSGRGIKGQKARSGSHKMRPGFEGGQNPIYMRLGKQRGPYSKDAMPIGPHRTKVQSVNVRDLERFDGEVTPEALKEAGLIRNTRTDLKILGHGDLTKKLTVSAHLFSASAREKIEQAGGTITWLRGEPKPKPKKVRRKPDPAAKKDAEPADAPDEETGAAEEPSVEPEAEAEDSQG
ncbi:MAG: 50S ribosomal protein L15 [Actinobacteria bacterium]|nr:50S ribosomal protein L15 [Actinomycetota bacterium]